ncbi:type II toxin-antitoxin system prevent-host-death family antitoxin [Brevundimonas sp.]|uniref:type II toxin-antitoxin system Phd/YefM family antitoxin n=1 Tax=Brevundimonas sp. TaxID=1871086 RepID=UPI002D33E1C0|nr:type II toxin-antitoxin system prevent-host-death family antitoxin [Brevundimonas sp.]HYC69080.1 type II toxin-antitoxin system prevent-host-death family antitoxin [Brevundimonas sp.]
MATYGVAEAKNKFTHLLDRVERGESITITRHGKPVAELRGTLHPAPKMTPEERRAAYDAFVKRRDALPPLGISAAELIRAMRDGDPE